MTIDSSEEKARARAFLLLKFRPRSESEFRTRLSRIGCGPVMIEKLVAEFKQKDLLNDAKFARYFAAQQMVMKPAGRRALINNLKAKGVDPALSAQAVEEAAEGKDELTRARELAESRVFSLKGLKKDAAQRRLFGFLSRRGFSSDVVYKVVREVTGPSDAGVFRRVN